jgi:thiol:disulfide interchange protein DsbD
MKRIILLFLMQLSVVAMSAQMADPVHFKTEMKMTGADEAEIVFTASIDPGWHVYSTDIANDGPTPATFHADKMEGAQLVGKLRPRGNVKEQFDEMFGTTLKFFEGKGAFVQKIRFTKPHYNISCYLEYGACNDEMCMPPTTVEFAASGEHKMEKDEAKEEKPEEKAEEPKDTVAAVVNEAVADTAAVDSAVVAAALPPTAGLASADSLWAPITDELKAYGQYEENSMSMSWWMIFIEGLLAGFLAILTPCVWPIIPMTVSFFLKRNKERKKAITEALVYGLSIVVIYVLLGLLVTLLFGASALNALSTNAIFNIFFALLLVVFAASFFGAFELTLPSSWSNKIDQKVDSMQSKGKGGTKSKVSLSSYLALFLMAFTLTLVSFSCTGPIVGFLLVAVSTQGDVIAPTIGMLGFAIALAIPFTLFAMFPSLLKSAPKSGGWMNTVKVVLGFIELAFALKFLSVADLAYGWHLLDRETFLALWIVLFALLGAYLLGWLRFPHDGERKGTNVPQFFLGWVSLAFAVYMVPGLWGAPLKAISAFSPPMYTQDFNLYDGSVEAKYTDYDLGMAAARQQNKPVMVDFTGFGCVNCRKMEAAVWTDPAVRSLLNEKYVLISLYVDDKTSLPEPIEVTDVDGTKRKLRTIGDKWSYLERTKIGANTQPFYVLLDPKTGKPLNTLRSYDEDVQQYIQFLEEGLKNYSK